MSGGGSSLWWVVPLTSLFAAGVGASAAFAGLVWRYRADYKRDIVLDLLDLIQHAADTATDYWILDPKTPDEHKQALSLEARIMGLSERIDAGLDAARPYLRKIDTLGMEIPWSGFLDNLSGGQFSNPTRDADLTRAQDVQIAAATLIRDLRIAADSKFLNGRP